MHDAEFLRLVYGPCTTGLHQIVRIQQVYSSFKLGRSFTVLEQNPADIGGADAQLRMEELRRRPLRHYLFGLFQKYRICPATSGHEIVEDLDLYEFFNPKAAELDKRAENDRAYSLLLQLPRVNKELADGEVWSARPGAIGPEESVVGRSDVGAVEAVGQEQFLDPAATEGRMQLFQDKFVYRGRDNGPRLERVLEVKVWQPNLAISHPFYLDMSRETGPMSISLACHDGQLKLSFQVGKRKHLSYNLSFPSR